MLIQITILLLQISNLAACLYLIFNKPKHKHKIHHNVPLSMPPARTVQQSTEKRSPKLINEIKAESELKRAQGWG